MEKPTATQLRGNLPVPVLVWTNRAAVVSVREESGQVQQPFVMIPISAASRAPACSPARGRIRSLRPRCRARRVRTVAQRLRALELLGLLPRGLALRCPRGLQAGARGHAGDELVISAAGHLL